MDLVEWCIWINYFYGRLTGVLNFKIDDKTGRPYITTGVTAYAAIINLLTCALVPLTLFRQQFASMWMRSNMLHEYIFVMMSTVRVIGVFASLWSRWKQRRRLIQLVNGFRRLMIKKPHVKRLFRRAVISKFICTFFGDILQMGVSFDFMRNYLSLGVILKLFFVFFLVSVFNVFIWQFYLSMLNVHSHYILLNYELKQILAETHQLRDQRRGVGVFVTKCCFLADRLDDIAQTQSELQELSKLMSEIFQVQGFCTSLIYYLTFVASIYLSYSAYRYSFAGMGWSTLGKILILSGLIAYYTDTYIVGSLMLYTIEAHAEMVKLMEERTLFPRNLDERLEESFEKFQLQLVRNPFKMTVMGLFTDKRSNSIVLGHSVITHSLFLIQYEIQNY